MLLRLNCPESERLALLEVGEQPLRLLRLVVAPVQVDLQLAVELEDLSGGAEGDAV